MPTHCSRGEQASTKCRPALTLSRRAPLGLHRPHRTSSTFPKAYNSNFRTTLVPTLGPQPFLLSSRPVLIQEEWHIFHCQVSSSSSSCRTISITNDTHKRIKEASSSNDNNINNKSNISPSLLPNQAGCQLIGLKLRGTHSRRHRTHFSI